MNRERNKEEREKKEACGGKRGTEREKYGEGEVVKPGVNVCSMLPVYVLCSTT